MESVNSFISLNTNAKLNESISQMLDPKTMDVTETSQGMVRDQSMSILDQVYETQLNKNVRTSRKGEGNNALSTQPDPLVTDPDIMTI